MDVGFLSGFPEGRYASLGKRMARQGNQVSGLSGLHHPGKGYGGLPV